MTTITEDMAEIVGTGELLPDGTRRVTWFDIMEAEARLMRICAQANLEAVEGLRPAIVQLGDNARRSIEAQKAIKWPEDIQAELDAKYGRMD
jgi:hypothetical protein